MAKNRNFTSHTWSRQSKNKARTNKQHKKLHLYSNISMEITRNKHKSENTRGRISVYRGRLQLPPYIYIGFNSVTLQLTAPWGLIRKDAPDVVTQTRQTGKNLLLERLSAQPTNQTEENGIMTEEKLVLVMYYLDSSRHNWKYNTPSTHGFKPKSSRKKPKNRWQNDRKHLKIR